MVPVHNGTLNCRWLHKIRRHMGWSQVGAPRLSLKLCLDIDAWRTTISQEFQQGRNSKGLPFSRRIRSSNEFL